MTEDQEFSEVLAATRYLPKSVKNCPECGDRDDVQDIVEGLSATPLTTAAEDRLDFAGCVIDFQVDEHGNEVPGPRWYCPTDELFGELMGLDCLPNMRIVNTEFSPPSEHFGDRTGGVYLLPVLI